MNARERNICSRVKVFREAIRWQQEDFADLIGITRDKLQSIEYGRTPLRYEIAWRIRVIFGISLEHLAEGEYPANATDLAAWPIPTSFTNTGFLLSEAMNYLREKQPQNTPAAADVSDELTHNPHAAPTPARHRLAWLELIEDELGETIARVRREDVIDFSRKVLASIEKTKRRFKIESEQKSSAQLSDLLLERWRTNLARRLLRREVAKKEFDYVTDRSNTERVKSKANEMQKLRDDLKRATASPGMKAELARLMKVKPPRISEWLSGQEPGGEYALKLRAWADEKLGLKPTQ